MNLPLTFGQPWFLLLLLLLPVLAWLKGKGGQPPAFVYSSVQLARAVLNVSRSRSGAFLAALRWFALGLFILALAQPRLTHSETQVSASGIDIAVAIDLSASMESEDFQLNGRRVNRLAMAKSVLTGFIDERPNDRIGLVAFASEAYIAAPLTLDHDFLLSQLKRLELGTIDPGRTAIGSALSAAVNRLRDLKSKSRIAILMTDGQNNAGDIEPLTAAAAAKALNVKVYTIGVGTRGMAPRPQYGLFGRTYRMEPVDIDEDTLQKIAQMTGGKYYRADNTERLQAIYGEINKLEKSEAQVKKYARHDELFLFFLAPGFGLFLVELLLKHTTLRRLP